MTEHAPLMQPDLSWLGVLEHHAAPHAGQAARGLRRRRRHLPGDGRTGPRRWRPGCTRAASAPATSSGCSRTTASSSWRRSSPPTTSARSRCRSTGGSRRRSCGSSSSTPRRARSCATTQLVDSRTRRPTGLDGELVRVCISTERRRRVGAVRRPRAPTPRPSTRVAVAGRRPPPADVHVGHHRAPEGRHDHPRQPGVEELRAHHRVRLHRADVGLACGPLYHVGALDLITTSMIAVGATTIVHRVFDAERGRRRDRAVAGHHDVARAGDGPRDPRRPRHRAARPLVGAGDHRRRREDADPVHRAPPPDVPVGVVRRRVRPHRDGVGRHLPRPGQHASPSSAASAGPCLYLELDIWDERRRVGARRASGARSSCAARRCSRATGATPTRPRTAFAGGWFHTGDIGVQRRRRLPLHRRPAQGHDRVRRREHRQLRGRAGALRARRRWSRPRWSAAPTSAGARSRSPTSSSRRGATDDARRAHRALPRRSSRSSRSRRTSCSSTRSRGTRRARSSSGSCAIQRPTSDAGGP